jgi:DNA-binding XRE family transcriptional regulator
MPFNGFMAGRPSKYDPKYCNDIIVFMSEGKSQTAFAGKIGITRGTINDWADEHPEFAESLEIAKAKCQAYWEDLGQAYLVEDYQGSKINAQIYQFNMRNRFKEDYGVGAESSDVNVNLGNKTDDELKQIVDDYLKTKEAK